MHASSFVDEATETLIFNTLTAVHEDGLLSARYRGNVGEDVSAYENEETICLGHHGTKELI